MHIAYIISVLHTSFLLNGNLYKFYLPKIFLHIVASPLFSGRYKFKCITQFMKIVEFIFIFTAVFGPIFSNVKIWLERTEAYMHRIEGQRVEIYLNVLYAIFFFSFILPSYNFHPVIESFLECVIING